MQSSTHERFKNECKEGDLEIVRVLLQDPLVDPSDNENNNQAIRCAIMKGHCEVVKLLLKDSRAFR